MTTQLESAARAGEDVLARATVSIIAKTRRHWAALPDRRLAPETVIAVGVGYAALTRDGETVYEEDRTGQRDLMTVAQAERLAQREPDREWRIHLVAQLDDRHYRREGAGRWVIYERGYGMS
ncbi:MAG TPA: hypothetical protein VFK92_08085 [Burkholderiales bacterium]|nr:hypothetical protein [Burkholderiales bacterium]